MRTINITTLSKVETKKNICWDVLVDYTHFLYRHKSSFDYFEVIKDDHDLQIFYYETKLFPWLPISPTKKFISIKEIDHKNYSFKQIYKDLNSKQHAYMSVNMIEKKENQIEITTKYKIEVGGLYYFLRRLAVFFIHLKTKQMWQEDKEMMIERLNSNLENEKICLGPQKKLYNFFKREFDNKIPNDFKNEFFNSYE
tara:strand:- start:193 stop:783 length:591 start_codon:yes stop_codon:yes gene_type:complete